ncbi:MAG: carbohydrate binding domain-containing protein [Prevotella sp.]|nr:carbohydrate binding domain-containing protein [Prevotella sp.]
MKKLFSKLMFVALTAMTFTACSDVPNPYDVPGTGQNIPGVADIPGGTGTGLTPEDPYNTIAAINFGNKLAQGDVSDWRFIKGKVSKIEEQFTTQYGNATFYISEDGSHGNEFYVYRVNYLANKKFASGDPELKVGDDVVINAKITNYNGTIETNQKEGFVLEHNGVNRGGAIYPSQPSERSGEPTGDGTLANPFNVAGILAFTNALADNAKSENDIYFKGKVSKIVNNYVADNYGNATFYVSEDGTENGQFYCYRALYLGNQKYTNGDLLKVGDEVIICGKVTKYVGSKGDPTPETVQNEAYLYSLNGNTEAGDAPTPQPTGQNILTNGDFESWTDGQPDHWKTTSTAGNATLTQSTDAHGGSYSVSVGFNATSNKRLGHEEITLKAGTYTFSFYAKSTTAEASQTQAGYVEVTNGTAGSYKYGGYVTLNNTEWTQVSTTFTLATEASVALVMMNPKTSSYATAQDILVDDATLVTSDGGLADGTEPNPNPNPNPDPTGVQTVTIAEFNAAAESTSVWYQLTGTISNLKDGDLYGNFDLTDASGSVYVYGVLSEKGGAKKLFQELVSQHGIANGTTITIIGNRGSYNGKIEVTNAYFVSVSK